MNKKLLVICLIGMFAVTLVAAGYLVNSFVITTDIYEPFTVEYAILGNAGNYVSGTCAEYNGTWTTGTDVDVGGLYIGESRKVCTKIKNDGEGDISYTFSREVLNEGVNCTEVFENINVTGVATGSSTVFNGAVVDIAEDAPSATGCQIRLSVERG